jgi:hypothetical protein
VLELYVASSSAPQYRFPRYFSFDLRVSKDIQINRKHAIRLSASLLNLTNHFNLLEVHSNVADPQYGAPSSETTLGGSSSISTCCTSSIFGHPRNTIKASCNCPSRCASIPRDEPDGGSKKAQEVESGSRHLGCSRQLCAWH